MSEGGIDRVFAVWREREKWCPNGIVDGAEGIIWNDLSDELLLLLL